MTRVGSLWGLRDRIGPMAWLVVTVAAACAVSAAVIIIRARQHDMLTHMAREQALLGKARSDLSRGYLHASLAGRPQYPFDRSTGLALLDQAGESLAQALESQQAFMVRLPSVVPRESVASQLSTFAHTLSEFRDALASRPSRWSASPADEVTLRITFAALERQADLLDTIVQQDLSALMQHYNRQLQTATWGGGILLALICGGLYSTGRARQQAQQALQESETRYRSLFEHNQAVMLVVDPDSGALVDANPAACTYYGWTRHELLQKTISDINTLTPSEVAAEMRLAQTEQRHCFLFKHRLANGAVRDVEVYSGPVRLRGRDVLYSIVHDITSRREAEAALRESEERFQLVTEHAGEWVWEVDAAGLYTYASPAVEKILGYEPHAVVGTLHFYDLFAPDHKEQLTKTALDHMASLRPFVRFRNHCQHADGHLVLLDTSGTPFFDEDDRLLGYRGVDKDITDTERLESQYLRAQRLEGIGALASGIAHDINNVLAPIRMVASIARTSTDDPETVAMLDTVESCAARGADIIKQLLTFARGKPGARIPLPVRHLMRDVEKMVSETFPRDIRTTVHTEVGLWPLLGDPTQIHQALMNLCVNARDAMNDGGTLQLRARNVSVDESSGMPLPDARPGPYVCVSVADTGEGIAPEHLDQIFDPFFTTKEIGKGTGLGLATVLGIVRGHGGFVRVDSHVGRGTTIELFFPAAPDAPVTGARDGRNEAVPQGQGELVLVVDDEPAVRAMVQRSLETGGYRVVTAKHGEDGLRVFSRHRSELRAVLTDMMMPVMNGPAMIHALRATDPSVHVLGMTGLTERSSVKGLDDLPLAALLLKPFSRDELLMRLHALLHRPDGAGGMS